MSRQPRPPYGLCLPCQVVRVIDGDTVIVSFKASEREWKLRLINCWCAEMNTADGKRAKKGAEDFLRGVTTTSVFIPAPRNAINLLSNLTFDRIPAYLYLDHELTLNEALCLAGFATSQRPKKN